MLRRVLFLLLLSVACAPDPPVWAQTAASPGFPETPAGSHAHAMLRAVRQGDEAAIRRFFAEHVDPGFREEFPMEEHLRMFRRMNADFGDGELVRFEAAGPGAASFQVRSPRSGATFQIELELEPQPPHRIAGIGVRPLEGAAPAPVSIEMSAEARREAVERVAELIERNYVSADTGQMIARHLRQRQSAGAYEALTTWPRLAETLTTDVRSVNGDRHLNVRFAGGGAQGGPGGGPQRVGGTGGPAGPGGGGPAGSGIERVERLPGNLGYLKLGIVAGSPAALDSMAAALRTLERTDAVILDLRGVPGGSAQMANFLISHFTAPNVLSLGVYTPATNDTTLRYTLAEVPGPRRQSVPLYVLVDSGSASAAEDIPFVLQNLGRAKIVGERTAGAGRNNRILPVGNGLSVSISVTRVFDPRTGREWERVGIQPDLAVPSGQALVAAQRDALESLLRTTRDASRRRELQRALAALQG